MVRPREMGARTKMMRALRHNRSAYDATYVALAEISAETALLTTDARLDRAPGIKCTIQLL
jgi:predicted nucleic acid-binding protein